LEEERRRQKLNQVYRPPNSIEVRDTLAKVATQLPLLFVRHPVKREAMAQSHLPNTMPLRPLQADTTALLRKSLEEVVQENPPLEKYDDDTLVGLAAGYTSLAYLFFRIAQRHRDLHVGGHDCMYWAKKYIAGDRGSLELTDSNCGLVCEKLAFEAVKACITKDDDDVAAFLGNIPRLVDPTREDAFPNEMIYGRGAVLYMLRMIRTFVPNSLQSVNEAIAKVGQQILHTKGNWLWNGKRYYGAPHGDIGIITQLVLSDPSLAPGLTTRLDELLHQQNESGNWPDTDEVREDADKRVQFCHGAPGFIFALQALRPFYPDYHARFDAAIANGRQVTWTRGFLVKEPSLCHGLLGNGL